MTITPMIPTPPLFNSISRSVTASSIDLLAREPGGTSADAAEE